MEIHIASALLGLIVGWVLGAGRGGVPKRGGYTGPPSGDKPLDLSRPPRNDATVMNAPKGGRR